MRKLSLGDVAKSLGVSKTLISFVINGLGDERGISKKTQKLVLDKVKEMGYRPNAFARNLRRGNSKTIGVVVADISNPFYSKICRSIEDEAFRMGYNVLFCSSDENEEKEESLVNMLVERQVDGIILSPTRKAAGSLLNINKDIMPVLLIDRYFKNCNLQHVVVDNQHASYEAVSHLIENGHRNIGVLAISPVWSSVMKDRLSGYKNALKINGIRLKNDIIAEIDFDKIDDLICGYLSEMIEKHNVTALFSLNNTLTVKAIRCLSKMNIKVPGDISILSFDDLEIFEILKPGISAIAQPVETLGRTATHILVNEMILEGKQDVCKVLKASFVERTSIKKN